MACSIEKQDTVIPWLHLSQEESSPTQYRESLQVHLVYDQDNFLTVLAVIQPIYRIMFLESLPNDISCV